MWVGDVRGAIRICHLLCICYLSRSGRPGCANSRIWRHGGSCCDQRSRDKKVVVAFATVICLWRLLSFLSCFVLVGWLEMILLWSFLCWIVVVGRWSVVVDYLFWDPGSHVLADCGAVLACGYWRMDNPRLWHSYLCLSKNNKCQVGSLRAIGWFAVR